MQEKAYEAIREVYQGSVPNPDEFDRVEYIKALHTVSAILLICTSWIQFPVTLGRIALLCSRSLWISSSDCIWSDL